MPATRSFDAVAVTTLATVPVPLIWKLAERAPGSIRNGAVNWPLESFTAGSGRLAPGVGGSEDPVSGSFNASLAQWLIADGIVQPRYVAAQGTCIGRAGRVYIEQDAAGQVWVGGDSVTCITGEVTL